MGSFSSSCSSASQISGELTFSMPSLVILLAFLQDLIARDLPLRQQLKDESNGLASIVLTEVSL